MFLNVFIRENMIMWIDKNAEKIRFLLVQLNDPYVLNKSYMNDAPVVAIQPNHSAWSMISGYYSTWFNDF